jgi:RimJ/RimL family protein N-acetyltransferase
VIRLDRELCLHTERLKLTLMREEDVDEVLSLLSPTVLETCWTARFFQEDPLGFAARNGEWSIDQGEEDERISFVVRLHAGNAIGLVSVARSDGRAWMGYFIGDAFTGRGYVTEAAGRVMGYLLEELGLPEVSAMALDTNAASIRVLEKLGMTYFKTTPWLIDGRETLWPSFEKRRADRV